MGSILKANDRSAQARVMGLGERELHWPIKKLAEQITQDIEEQSSVLPKPDETVELRQQLVDLGERWDLLRIEAEAAETKAFERGLEEGKRVAAALEQEKLDTLRVSIEKAQHELDDKLTDLQSLSLQIAQLSLSKIIGNADNHAELVARSIQHHCENLSADLLIAIRVSAADFPDPEALALLSKKLGRSEIVADAQLGSGACIIDLKLGHHDIGIGSQWERLRALYQTMACEGA